MEHVIQALTRIIQKITHEESPTEQVRLIVDSISQVAGTDVCSLYRKNADGDLALLASHGLEVNHPLVIPADKGLVGLVARSRHPINVAEAARHEAFYYVPDSLEERFASFCGVPLVQAGKVIGVLTVQRTRAEKISDAQEAFLVTLASQLALIIAQIPPETQKPHKSQHYQGLPAAPGVALGNILICESGLLNDVPDSQCDDPRAESKKWHRLLASVVEDVKREQAALGNALSDSVIGIFDAYLMLLSDSTLVQGVEAEIQNNSSLSSAIRKTVLGIAAVFKNMEDPYLRARHEDILHLGNKLLQSLKGQTTLEHSTQTQPPLNGQGQIVLVGHQVSVSQMAAIPNGQLAGVVSGEGSRLSHTAVLANAMGVPAVMGVGSLKGLKSQLPILINGSEGYVVLQPSPAVLKAFGKQLQKEQKIREQLATLRDEPAETTDGYRVRLFANTGLLADISPGIKNGAEGIGLYRTEIPFMVRNSFPNEDEQVEVYQSVFNAYTNKPVYMRTLDIGGDKQLPYFPIHAEDNPALGWRGIRFTLDNIQLMMTQVRAMVRAAGKGNQLNILLPMISSTTEVNLVRELIEDACQQLMAEGYDIDRPKMGIMLEVPAATSQIPFWKDKIDFISIGSNDLSQYLLALDRNNIHVADRYDHVHPAVLHEIDRIVDIARLYKIPLSLCGEMASDPVAVVLLVGMGIQQLSMSSSKLPRIKRLIRAISAPMASTILHQALAMDNAHDIRQWVKSRIKELKIDELTDI